MELALATERSEQVLRFLASRATSDTWEAYLATQAFKGLSHCVGRESFIQGPQRDC